MTTKCHNHRPNNASCKLSIFYLLVFVAVCVCLIFNIQPTATVILWRPQLQVSPDRQTGKTGDQTQDPGLTRSK